MEKEKYLNVAYLTTFVVKMRTLIKKAYWNILNLFYSNGNRPLHLREISRRMKLDQGALTRHLKKLTSAKILRFEREGNLKKFCIHTESIRKIFPAYDEEKQDALPLLRKNALKYYIEYLNEKPVFLVLFGSTAKGTFREESDMDIIAVFNKKTDTGNARKYVQSQTGITLNEFQITYDKFIKELKLKEDNVIQAGIETGFPVYNRDAYYKVLYHE